jgi:hypothetical protein
MDAFSFRGFRQRDRTVEIKKEKDAQSIPKSDQEAGREHRQHFCPSTIIIWE